MKIKMNGTWQSPDRSVRAGDAVDVSEKEAVKLVGNGSAVYAEGADVTAGEKPVAGKNSAGDKKERAALDKRQGEIDKALADIDEMVDALDERETALDEREKTLESVESELAEKIKESEAAPGGDENTSNAPKENTAARTGKGKDGKPVEK